MQYLIYLRKSRADREAEQRGEGETLARHEKTLLDLAKRKHLPIGDIYKEVVSGETIASRPMMQKLLSEVEQGIWNGVLVMEVERLARGDTIDQGIVAQAFKLSDTKIITPIKTYDPNNEFDEEYFEFGLFMSRREYKTIKRRLNTGRMASVKDGKYVGNIAPYGYERVKITNDKGFTISPIPSEANIVKAIFRWYAYSGYGCTMIANALNDMAVPTRNNKMWVYPTVRDILQNPVYIGKIRWGWRGQRKSVKNGSVSISRPRSNDYTLVDGIHQPIIEQHLYDQVQHRFAQHKPLPVSAKSMKNPLAGLMICAKCGKKMQRRPYQSDKIQTGLICPNNRCKNVSAPIDAVEKKIITAIADWVNTEKLNDKTPEIDYSNLNLLNQQIENLKKELNELLKQNDNIHDLLEKGIYDIDTFLVRSKKISEQISDNELTIDKLENELILEQKKIDSTTNVIPKAKKLLQIYNDLSVKEKNDLLKEILYKIEYERDKSIRDGGTPDNFTITLYPKTRYK